MRNDAIPIQKDPKSALSSYIEELDEYYYPWYESAAEKNYWMWAIAQGTAVITGLATAVLAAFMQEDLFKDFNVFRICLISLPVVGTLASTFLIQTRVRDLLALRERGRQSIQTLISSARAEYAAASTLERFTQIHRDLIQRVGLIEKEQTVGFFTIIPDLTRSTNENHSKANSDV